LFGERNAPDGALSKGGGDSKDGNTSDDAEIGFSLSTAPSPAAQATRFLNNTAARQPPKRGGLQASTQREIESTTAQTIAVHEVPARRESEPIDRRLKMV